MVKKARKSFRGRVGRNMDKKKSEKGGQSYLKLPEGVSLFKPEKGTIKFDILPYNVTDGHHLDRDDDNGDAVVGDIWWKRPFKVHKNVGVDKDTVVCPKTIGKPCPICEYGNKLNDEGEEWDDIKEIFSKDRSLYAIIPVDASEFDEKYEEKPYIFDMSYHLFEKQLEEECQVDEDNEMFPNLEGGLTLDVRFREKKFGKAVYYETAVIKFEERDADYEDDYVDSIPNLDDLLTILSYEQLKIMYFEQGDPNDVAEEEEFIEVESEEEESAAKPARKPKKASKEVEEEESAVKEKKGTKPTRSDKSAKKEEEEEEQDCPHGHTYAVDGNDKDECSDCEKWDDCMDAQEKMNE